MPITRQEKEAVVEFLRDKFNESKVVILADYLGMNVGSMNELRKKMRESGSKFKVVKNTLTKRVVRELNLDGLEKYLEGPTALATNSNDPVAPAKVLKDFAKQYKELKVKAGVLEGKVVDVSAIQALADLPPREVLLAQVVGGMQAPLAGFAGTLQGVLRKFVYALEAVRQKKAGENAG